MAKPTILQEGQSYTFRSYFEMPYEADEILAELGYTLTRAELPLPRSAKTIEELPRLKQKLKTILQLVSLSNEAARREAIVAPILLEIACFCHCQMRIEYPLSVNSWLKGNLDYLLRSRRSLLVVEAKHDDLTRGFTQLAAELIALSEAEDREVLYGAVTIGEIWRFGQLDRRERSIIQDIESFRVPGDLENLASVLVGILEGELDVC
jgi:hypothetical protein